MAGTKLNGAKINLYFQAYNTAIIRIGEKSKVFTQKSGLLLDSDPIIVEAKRISRL